MSSSYEFPWLFFMAILLVVMITGIWVRRFKQSGEDTDEGGCPDVPPSQGEETPWDVCQEQFHEIATEDELKVAEEIQSLPKEELGCQPQSSGGVRRCAWRQFVKQYRRLLPIGLIAALLYVATETLFPVITHFTGWQASGFLFVLRSLSAPILMTRMCAVGWAVWHEDTPSIALLGQQVFPIQRLSKTWILGALQQGLYLLLDIVSVRISVGLILMLNRRMDLPIAVNYLLIAVAGIMIIWCMLRLSQLQFVLINTPDAKLIEILGYSWRITKRRVWRILRVRFSVEFPIYFLVMLGAFLLAKQSPEWSGAWIVALLNMIARIFLYNYSYVVRAGLAAELINTQGMVRNH